MTGNLISSLLLGLCINYPFSNITVTTPPPWKWVPEKQQYTNGNESFHCILKNANQIRSDVLKGKRLKIATIAYRPPISWVLPNGNNTYKGYGIAFQIVDTLSEKFGFSYDVMVPKKHTLMNQKGGIINMLIQGEVDMIAAFIPVLPGLEHLIQWGTELSYYEYVVMMKRPKESATGSGLLAPFEIEVWFLILVSLIIVGPIIYGIMLLRSKLCDGCKVYPLSSCVWFVYSALMKQGSSLSPDYDSIRIMFASWWLFIMILTAFYTANLTAFLTLSRFTLPIQTIEDIADPAYRWIAPFGGAIEYSVKMDTDLSALRQSWTKGRGQFVSHNDQNIKSHINNGVLFLHERHWLNFYMLNLERAVTNEKDHCKFVLTTRTYLRRSLSFVFPKHSILPELFDKDMLSYVESGIIKHLLTKDLPGAVICPLNLGSKERQLRNSDLLTTYAVVVTGFSIATAIFFAEICTRIFCKFNKNNSTQKSVVNRLKRNEKTIQRNRTFQNELKLNNKIIFVNRREYFQNRNKQISFISNNTLSDFFFNK